MIRKITTITTFVIVILLLGGCSCGRSANKNEIIGFEDVDIKPAFQGDTTLTAFHNWVRKSIYYPGEDHPTGRVIVSFDILNDGSLANVVIVNGIDPSIDQITRETILNSPKWAPGRFHGKPCSTRITDFVVIWILH